MAPDLIHCRQPCPWPSWVPCPPLWVGMPFGAEPISPCPRKAVGMAPIKTIPVPCAPVADSVSHSGRKPPSFPFDRCRRLAADIVDDAVDPGDAVDDSRGDAGQQILGQPRPVGG